ncbi:MAG TPA: hypothetical protein PKH77_27665 [Anaerolineae bacterium]|nr:hypothetical protein [Anaerolineae bacterium]
MMKILHRGILGAAMVLLVLLAAIPVVWATPEQSLHNQSIPTRTSAPPQTEPAPTPVMAASGPQRNLDAAFSQTADATPTPEPPKSHSGALPALPDLPDIAALPGRQTGASDGSGAGDQAGDIAGIPEHPANGPNALPFEDSSSENIQADHSPLRWLFPGHSASQPLALPALLGMSLLILGIGLLVFAGRHSAK